MYWYHIFLLKERYYNQEFNYAKLTEGLGSDVGISAESKNRRYYMSSIIDEDENSSIIYVNAVFVAEVLLSSQPLGEMFIAGLLIYLCIVIVICTRLILKKLSDG